MSARNPKTHCSVKTLIAGGRLTATGNGTGVDARGWTHAVAVFDFGNGGGTTPTLDIKLQESTALAGTYTDIVGAVFTQVTAAGGGKQQIELLLAPRMGFIRAVRTITGTSPTYDGALELVCINPEDSAIATDTYVASIVT